MTPASCSDVRRKTEDDRKGSGFPFERGAGFFVKSVVNVPGGCQGRHHVS